MANKKPNHISTAMGHIQLTYTNDKPLNKLENSLIKKYVNLQDETAKLIEGYKNLLAEIKQLQKITPELSLEFSKLKTMRQNVLQDMDLHYLMDDIHQASNYPQLVQKTDMFNVDIIACEKKVAQADDRLRAALNKLNQLDKEHLVLHGIEEDYDEGEEYEKSLYEQVDDLMSEVAENWETGTIDTVTLDDDWQAFLEHVDGLSQQALTCSNEWEVFVKEYNLFIADFNLHYTQWQEDTKMQQQKEKDEEQKEREKEKQDILNQAGEYRQELMARYESSLQNNTPLFLDVDEWNLIIDFYWHIDDPAAREIAHQKAENQHPNDSSFTIRRAQALIGEHKFQEAMQLIKQAEEKGGSNHPALLYAKGTLYAEMKQNTQAKNFYRKAIETSTDEVAALRWNAYTNLSQLYEEEGNLKEALNILQECYDKKQYNDKILNNLAYLYEKNQRGKEAIPLLIKFLNDNPGFEECWHTLATLYWSSGEHEKAYETYDRALTIDPYSVATLLNKGEAYRSQGRFEEALHCYLKGLAHNPDEPLLHVVAAFCYEAMKNMEEAKNHCRAALHLDPDFALAQQTLQRLSK